ncbi:MAG: BrnT family toxin [Acidobacteria bacterium]|nr:MAG: BrnT family toxin [Acidobacteriota bacterium]
MTYNESVTIRLDWDEKKSRLLKRKRGLSFEDVARVFEGVTVELMKNDDPLQFAAIGLVGVDLVTVIFEERRDEEGSCLWLVTYWKSTAREREIYEQETKGLDRED